MYRSIAGEQATDLFEKLTRHSNLELAACAAQNLCELLGVCPRVDLDVSDDGRLPSDCPAPLRYAAAVWICDAEIKNGGMHQYFVNSFSSSWQDAIVGFNELGLLQHAELVRAAGIQFGSDGPPQESEDRHRQLAQFGKRQNDKLEEAAEAYFKLDGAQLDLALCLYALKHRELFRRS